MRLQYTVRFNPLVHHRSAFSKSIWRYYGSEAEGGANKANANHSSYKDLRLTSQVKLPQALVVRSKINDPYINLSIENYLLSHSQPDSKIYFFYINRPCIVLGRNQNPWLEVNLQKLCDGPSSVELIRRRSGGGTVFHDHGNLNYCVIMPPNLFTRNLHAQALAEALNKASIDKPAGIFEVNDRHDVVFRAKSISQPFKVSGSAYKLTKGRALHHGTCLVSSPNLSNISQFLHSPAKAFISAKGVESVSSKIGNVLKSSATEYIDEAKLDIVMDEIVNRFLECSGQVNGEDMLYHNIQGLNNLTGREENLSESRNIADEILAGATTLQDRDWKYLQTPRFTFVSHPEMTAGTEDEQSLRTKDPLAERGLPRDFPQDSRIRLSVKAGVIEDGDVPYLRPDISLKGRTLHQVKDWKDLVANEAVGNWLNSALLCPAS
ncbi:MAG: hypothetical protein Q9160_004481 [Pyrenula sp. 1 TL-2023]